MVPDRHSIGRSCCLGGEASRIAKRLGWDDCELDDLSDNWTCFETKLRKSCKRNLPLCWLHSLIFMGECWNVGMLECWNVGMLEATPDFKHLINLCLPDGFSPLLRIKRSSLQESTNVQRDKKPYHYLLALRPRLKNVMQ